MPGIDLSKCVLITGATAGIGRALAHKIKELPSKPQVIVAGRRQERLDELADEGFETYRMDVGSDRATLKKDVEILLARYPDLDTVILNAGIQREFDFTKEVDLEKIDYEINVNYNSVVALTTYFLPQLLNLGSRGRQCFIVTVTSGLSIIPSPKVPNYCASKAAVHSLTLCLQAQLAGTGVNVLEISPPLVESELHDAEGTTEALSKFWMPLEEFVTIVTKGLIAGTPFIGAGTSADVWNRFEKGKEEIVARLWKAF
ncbi:hypothetical protein D9756_003934 [Leucocoprinus leucothites]|uniref:NAD(P)-binding protein n=1 Tax=Leucocoprinus leucothites TaxID=201217 RepID=A0A8H5G0T8_9AGAR|nr:hypothetical protein D9756_003934 [Leucoagaricus leucothites]